MLHDLILIYLGHYMYGMGEKDTINTLVSPWLQIDTDSCVGFVYKKYRAVLQVSLLYKDESSVDLLTLSGEVNNFWHKQYVDIPKDGREVQLAFGIISTTFGYELSLDNIEVIQRRCIKGTYDSSLGRDIMLNKLNI